MEHLEAEKCDDMTEELVELQKLSVLGEDKGGFEIQIVLTNYKDFPAPKNVPSSSNQGEALYNADRGHGGISGGRK